MVETPPAAFYLSLPSLPSADAVFSFACRSAARHYAINRQLLCAGRYVCRRCLQNGPLFPSAHLSSHSPPPTSLHRWWRVGVTDILPAGLRAGYRQPAISTHRYHLAHRHAVRVGLLERMTLSRCQHHPADVRAWHIRRTFTHDAATVCGRMEVCGCAPAGRITTTGRHGRKIRN